MAALRSCIYPGEVMHARLRPVGHRFAYRVASFLFDLDELADLDRSLRLFAWNRPGLVSFHDRDHGARDGSPLRPWAEARLAEAGVDAGGGPIRILCFPRILGYVFNPLSVWLCHRPDGRLAAVIYEVSNTFGERHAYVAAVDGDHRGAHAHAGAKRMHVSPFIGMDATYRFRIRPPGERLSLAIRESDADGDLMVASLVGRRVPLDDRALARVLIGFPLLTLKVIGAIHWEALRLWSKRAPFHRKPAAPATGTTILGARGPEPTVR